MEFQNTNEKRNHIKEFDLSDPVGGVTVKIKDIADKMEAISEEWLIYLKKSTGEFVDISLEYLRIAEDLSAEEEIPDIYQDWEKDSIEAAIEVEVNWDDYVSLPSQFDIHEYSIMEDFVNQLSDVRKQGILEDAISGRGAFRRFKDKIYDLDLDESWFDYKYEAYCKIAREWCEYNGINYQRKTQKK